MNIIHRRKAAGVVDGATEELDTRPSYLKVFPTSSMLQDLQLGVLMGRQGFILRVLAPTKYDKVMSCWRDFN